MYLLLFSIPVMLGFFAVANYRRHYKVMGTGKVTPILETKLRYNLFTFLAILSLAAIFLMKELTTPLPVYQF